MAYFADLTHYIYTPNYPENHLNVGWLGEGHDFPKGFTSDKFIRALEAIWENTENRMNLMRGQHECEYCEIPDDIVERSEEWEYRSARKQLGTGEIHVRGANDIVYVAPSLIRHYVREHKYLPPEEFIMAVEVLLPYK